MKKILSTLLLVAVLLTMATPAFAADRTTFEIEEKDYYDITEPISIDFSASAEYDKAEILVEDLVVASYEGGSAGTIASELDLDGNVANLGDVNITAKVYYSDVVETVAVTKYITKLDERKETFKEDFSAENSVYCGMLYNLANNSDPFEKHFDEDGNKGIKYVFDETYKKDSQPFLSKDMRVPKGSLITMQFDVYFSSKDCYLIFETRYWDEVGQKNAYPKDGAGTRPQITLFTKSDKTIGGRNFDAETWYTCKYEINAITKGLQIYIKERDAEEFTLEYTYPNYVSYGLSHIRPVLVCTSNTGAFTAFDNFSVSYEGPAQQWHVKSTYENADGEAVASDKLPLEGGKINLAFSKRMNYADGSFKLVNEVGDEIETEVLFDEDTFKGKISPTKLRYNAKYSVVFDENLMSTDGFGPLKERTIDVFAEKYPINILKANKADGGVYVEVSRPDLVTNEKVAVACYNENGSLTEFNAAEISDDGCITVLLENNASSDKIVVYVISSVDAKEIYDSYEVK